MLKVDQVAQRGLPSKRQIVELETMVTSGDLGQIKRWFEHYCPSEDSLNPALNLAAHSGHTAIAAYLARQGAITNRPEVTECACASGDPITVVVLLEHGAPESAVDWEEQPRPLKNAYVSWRNSHTGNKTR